MLIKQHNYNNSNFASSDNDTSLPAVPALSQTNNKGYKHESINS